MTDNNMTPKDTEKIQAVVLGCYVNGLSIIRSLGRKGIPVVAVDYHTKAIGFSSKYSCQSIIASDPKVDKDKFLQFLLDKSSEWAGSILIPTHDAELLVLSYHKDELSKSYIVPVPDWVAVRKIVDKKETYEIATRLNVPVPKIVSVDSVGSLDSLQDTIDIDFPCLLKPRIGHEFYKIFNRKAFIIEDFEQLQRRLAEASQAHCDMMIQELIAGEDDQLYAYIAYYDKHHRPLAEFTGRKLRQNPPLLGTGRVAESTQTEEVVSPSRRMLKELSFTGLCAIEFKKDAKDGEYKLLEINGRSFMWMGLPIRCGIDFPWIMYNDLVWNKTLDVSAYSTGVKWIHETGDIRSAIQHPIREKLLTRNYLYPYFAPNTFAEFARDDWHPAVRAWCNLFEKTVQFAGRRMSRRS